MYNYKEDKLVDRKYPSYARNVDGPFYVSDQCILCSLPVETAPKNIMYDCAADCIGCPESCFVAKQPENNEELDMVLEALEGSETENIRYCGTDPKVLKRLEKNYSHLCDAL